MDLVARAVGVQRCLQLLDDDRRADIVVAAAVRPHDAAGDDDAEHAGRDRACAAARHDAALQRARGAIEHLDRAGQPITFTAVARAARVSRGWLYNQPDLRDAIIRLRRDVAAAEHLTMPAAQRASTESHRQRLDSARDEITRLRADNAALRRQLARSLGQQRLQR